MLLFLSLSHISALCVRGVFFTVLCSVNDPLFVAFCVRGIHLLVALQKYTHFVGILIILLFIIFCLDSSIYHRY